MTETVSRYSKLGRGLSNESWLIWRRHKYSGPLMNMTSGWKLKSDFQDEATDLPFGIVRVIRLVLLAGVCGCRAKEHRWPWRTPFLLLCTGTRTWTWRLVEHCCRFTPDTSVFLYSTALPLLTQLHPAHPGGRQKNQIKRTNQIGRQNSTD